MRFFFTSICFLFFIQVQSQNLKLYGISSSYSQTGKIAGKWGYNVNISSVINAKDQVVEGKSFPASHTHFIKQVLFVYQLPKKISLAGGYAHGRHNIFGLRENEHRYILQTGYQHSPLKNISVAHRLRYELRNPINLNTERGGLANIVRYQTWVNYFLFDQKRDKKGAYLSASNETFLYLTGANNGPVSSKNGGLVSENWVHLGAGYAKKGNRVELGYCFQYLVRNKNQDLRLFNLLQINAFYTVNWNQVQNWWYLPYL